MQQADDDASAAKGPVLRCSAESADQVGKEYLVDNSVLDAKTKGMGYRFSKDLKNVDRTAFALWGSTVKGVEDPDGWLKIGECFLPMKLKGTQVLVPVDSIKRNNSIQEGTLQHDSQPDLANQAPSGEATERRCNLTTSAGTGTDYLLDNSQLQASTKGMSFRRSQELADMDMSSKAVWGSVVRGIDLGQGWVQVGTCYLPVTLKGVQVLTPVKGANATEPKKDPLQQEATPAALIPAAPQPAAEQMAHQQSATQPEPQPPVVPRNELDSQPEAPQQPAPQPQAVHQSKAPEDTVEPQRPEQAGQERVSPRQPAQLPEPRVPGAEVQPDALRPDAQQELVQQPQKAVQPSQEAAQQSPEVVQPPPLEAAWPGPVEAAVPPSPAAARPLSQETAQPPPHEATQRRPEETAQPEQKVPSTAQAAIMPLENNVKLSEGSHPTDVPQKNCSAEAEMPKGKRYLLDNSQLQATTKGMGFRRSKDLQDVDKVAKAPWGSIVTGVDLGDGWVQVGDCYLPMQLKGRVVLTQEEHGSAVGNGSAPANTDVLVQSTINQSGTPRPPDQLGATVREADSPGPQEPQEAGATSATPVIPPPGPAAGDAPHEEAAPASKAPPAAPSEAVATEVVPASFAPAEVVTAKVASADAAPTMATPTVATPMEAAPTDVTPAASSPAKAMPAEAETPGATSIKAESREAVHTAAASTEAARTEAAPIEAVPAGISPTETMPAEAASAEANSTAAGKIPPPGHSSASGASQPAAAEAVLPTVDAMPLANEISKPLAAPGVPPAVEEAARPATEGAAAATAAPAGSASTETGLDRRPGGTTPMEAASAGPATPEAGSQAPAEPAAPAAGAGSPVRGPAKDMLPAMEENSRPSTEEAALPTAVPAGAASTETGLARVVAGTAPAEAASGEPAAPEVTLRAPKEPAAPAAGAGAPATRPTKEATEGWQQLEAHGDSATQTSAPVTPPSEEASTLPDIPAIQQQEPAPSIHQEPSQVQEPTPGETDLERRFQKCPTEADTPGGRPYLVDNSQLQASTKGMAFRLSSDNKDIDKASKALWGSVVIGMDRGNGWLQVGNCFLPMTLKDVPVLTPVQGAGSNNSGLEATSAQFQGKRDSPPAVTEAALEPPWAAAPSMPAGRQFPPAATADVEMQRSQGTAAKENKVLLPGPEAMPQASNPALEQQLEKVQAQAAAQAQQLDKLKLDAATQLEGLRKEASTASAAAAKRIAELEGHLAEQQQYVNNLTARSTEQLENSSARIIELSRQLDEVKATSTQELERIARDAARVNETASRHVAELEAEVVQERAKALNTSAELTRRAETSEARSAELTKQLEAAQEGALQQLERLGREATVANETAARRLHEVERQLASQWEEARGAALVAAEQLAASEASGVALRARLEVLRREALEVGNALAKDIRALEEELIKQAVLVPDANLSSADIPEDASKLVFARPPHRSDRSSVERVEPAATGEDVAQAQASLGLQSREVRQHQDAWSSSAKELQRLQQHANHGHDLAQQLQALSRQALEAAQTLAGKTATLTQEVPQKQREGQTAERSKNLAAEMSGLSMDVAAVDEALAKRARDLEEYLAWQQEVLLNATSSIRQEFEAVRGTGSRLVKDPGQMNIFWKAAEDGPDGTLAGLQQLPKQIHSVMRRAQLQGQAVARRVEALEQQIEKEKQAAEGAAAASAQLLNASETQRAELVRQLDKLSTEIAVAQSAAANRTAALEETLMQQQRMTEASQQRLNISEARSLALSRDLASLQNITAQAQAASAAAVGRLKGLQEQLAVQQAAAKQARNESSSKLQASTVRIGELTEELKQVREEGAAAAGAAATRIRDLQAAATREQEAARRNISESQQRLQASERRAAGFAAQMEDLRHVSEAQAEQLRDAEGAQNRLNASEQRAMELKAQIQDLRHQAETQAEQLRDAAETQRRLNASEVRAAALAGKLEGLQRHAEEQANQLREAAEATQQRLNSSEFRATELAAQILDMRHQAESQAQQLRDAAETQRRLNASEVRAGELAGQLQGLQTQAEEQAEQLRNATETAQNRLNASENRALELSEEVKDLRHQVDFQTEHHRRAAESAQRRINASDLRAAELAGQVESLQEQAKAQSEQLKDTAEAHKRLKASELRVAELMGQVDALRSEADRMAGQLREAVSTQYRLRASEQRTSELAEQVEGLKRDAERQAELLRNASNSMEHLRASEQLVSELRAQIEEMRGEVEREARQLREATTSSEEAVRQVSELTQQLERERLAKLKADGESYQRLMDSETQKANLTSQLAEAAKRIKDLEERMLDELS